MKLVKIQNTFKVISDLKTAEVERLVRAGQNVIFEDKKPVFGIAVNESTASFTGKDATFNQTSDKGYAMLTVECSPEYLAQFASEEEAIKNFAEEHLEAIHNLTAAEPAFRSIIENLNSSVEAITAETKIINID